MNDEEETQLSDRQLMAIPHLVSSPTLEEGRRRAEIANGTLYNWLKDPEFRRELQRQRNEVAKDALDHLKGAAGKAVDTLIRLMDSQKPYIRKAAAEKIIDYTLKAIEIEEIEERLAKVEEFVLKQRSRRWA